MLGSAIGIGGQAPRGGNLKGTIITLALKWVWESSRYGGGGGGLLIDVERCVGLVFIDALALGLGGRAGGGGIHGLVDLRRRDVQGHLQ